MRLHLKGARLLIAAVAAGATLSACGAVGSGGGTSASSTSASSGTEWSAPSINTQLDGSTAKATYTPIATDKITKKWKICVLFPHMKDSYWAATNYGTLLEAQRDKVSYQMFEAGGYDNLAKQVSQMQDCITQSYDAIILGAISSKGLCAQIASALSKSIPVVDFINGVNCPDSAKNPKFSHALVSFHDLAVTTANYLKGHTSGRKSVVGFFPGPEGAGWSDAAVLGFNEALKGTDVKIAVTRRGDTGKDVQLNLIDDALKAYPDITDVVGVDIAGEAAVVAVRNANKQGKVNIYAFDLIPPVFDAIVSGDAVGSPTDFTSIQGRMAVDQAVRVLEGQTLPAPTSGPIPQMMTKDNAKSVPYNEMFAPKDFKATYSWNPS
jgi:protein TorT